MGIDGIGKPGATPPLLERAPVERPAGVGSTFSVGGPAATTAASGATAASALAALQRGEIDVPRYLELHVEAATAHLHALPPAQLELVRDTLRAQLRSDPVLTELVQRATGVAPSELP